MLYNFRKAEKQSVSLENVKQILESYITLSLRWKEQIQIRKNHYFIIKMGNQGSNQLNKLKEISTYTLNKFN